MIVLYHPEDEGGASAEETVNEAGGLLGLSDAKTEESEQPPPKEGERDALRMAVEAKPDYLLDNYWDSEKGEVLVDALAKSQADTKKELDRLKGELKKNKEEQPKVPEKAEEYLPQDLFDSEGNFVAPEGVPSVPLKKDDPVLTAMMDAALEGKVPQENFQAMLTKYLETIAPFLPESINAAEELSKLGDENPKGLVSAADMWLKGLPEEGWASPDEVEAVRNMMNVSGHAVRWVLKVREQLGEKPINIGNPVNEDGVMSQHELHKRFNDDRYGMDEAFTKRTDEMAEALGLESIQGLDFSNPG